jgi:ribosome-binding factor A
VTGEPGLRARRVGAQIREALTDLLSRDVSDPALEGLVVTAVTVSDDLGIARVRVRFLSRGDDERRSALDHLGRARKRLRHGVGRALRLKRVPELLFVYDSGVDHALRVEELLAEIAADSKKPQDTE